MILEKHSLIPKFFRKENDVFEGFDVGNYVLRECFGRNRAVVD